MNRARLVLVATAAAAALALAGCSTPPGNNNIPDSRLVGQWQLVTANDALGAIPLTGTYITLTVAQGRAAHGRGPCDPYTANVVGGPGAVFIRVTERADLECGDSQIFLVNGRYVDALRASSVASVSANRMTLASPQSTLTFRRIPYFMIGGVDAPDGGA